MQARPRAESRGHKGGKWDLPSGRRGRTEMEQGPQGRTEVEKLSAHPGGVALDDLVAPDHVQDVDPTRCRD